jgi:hypothetical protein
MVVSYWCSYPSSCLSGVYMQARGTAIRVASAREAANVN